MSNVLYPWQEECLQRWFENQCRGMVQAVTGSGKTLLALNAIKQLEKNLSQELHVKIVVPSGALMRQWSHALKNFLSDSPDASLSPFALHQSIGLRGAGCKMPADRQYMIYVINSARYELARQILRELQRDIPVLLIADECHRYESEQNQLIFEFLPHRKPSDAPFFSLGLSATLPGRQSASRLPALLGPEIYRYEIKKAAALHTVCPCDIYHISLSFQKAEQIEYDEITERMLSVYRSLLHAYPLLRDMNLKERFELITALTREPDKKTAQAASAYLKLSYKRKTLVCLASGRISCVCELVRRLPETEKILIFGERISQADELYRLLQKQYPERVGRCHSQMGQTANQNTLDRFRDGSLRILIACKSIDEGIDIPESSIGIVLSGTSMQRQRIQRLGRIIRNARNKDRASLYYLHLADTTEERCFLPDEDTYPVYELEYLANKQLFIHSSYDKAAAQLLKTMEHDGVNDERLQEVRRCLRLGIVRSDWLLSQKELEEKLRSCSLVSEKNYWICMKKMRDLETDKSITP